MGLDILLFRQDQHLVRESQRRRYADVSLVDQVIEADQRWSKVRYETDQIRARKNAISKKFGKVRKQGGDVKSFQEESTALTIRLEELTAEVDAAKAERERLLCRVGNLVHDSVPVSDNEDHNVIERIWGQQQSPGRAHDQLLEMIDGVDMVRGSKVAGHRGYFLKGPAVELNQAIMMLATRFVRERGFTLIQTPALMRRDLMAKTAQLSDFDEMLYKVKDKYLIATSEQPLSTLHAGEWLLPPPKAGDTNGPYLPLRYGGISQCFRMEAGSAGRDIRGIFRVHQFEKVEQFCIVEPEESWAEHEQMLHNAEEFLQALGLPYRVVNVVSGALNNASAKKYDIEAWFPNQQKYRELVSCSNCTDFQARALEIRCCTKQPGQKKYVHMLNSTLAANTRVLCCILENYQTNTGIVIPEVLRPLMGGCAFLPFVAPARDEDTTK